MKKLICVTDDSKNILISVNIMILMIQGKMITSSYIYCFLNCLSNKNYSS